MYHPILESKLLLLKRPWFESNGKYLHEEHSGSNFVVENGEPERMLSKCSYMHLKVHSRGSQWNGKSLIQVEPQKTRQHNQLI